MEPVETPKQRQREGGRPPAGTRAPEAPYRSSLIKMERRESSSSCKDTVGLSYCQAIGREVRIIHYREGQYRQAQFCRLREAL